MQKKKIRVLLDLDGVIVDFARQYKVITGKTPDDVYVAGSVPTPEKNELWNLFVKEEGFIDAPSKVDAPELLSGIYRLIKTGKVATVEICSSAGGKEHMIEVTRQKRAWLKSAGLDELVAHIVQNGYKKADVINKEMYHDILIDDTQAVIDNFAAHGGYVVHHTSSADSVLKLESIVNELLRD